LLKKSQAPLCFECHDAFPPLEPGMGGSLHRPVAQGNCAGCHAPHGSAVGKLLQAPASRELCLKCHKDPTRSPEGGEWAVPHPALDDGCTACHLPHQGAASRLLAKPQRELCAGCHEDKNLDGDGNEWAVPHPPVKSGMCASCHGPHGAPELNLLLKSPFDVCRSCHVEVHERHLTVEVDPATGQPASGKATLPSGALVRKRDGMLACTICHRPHGSGNEKMWIRESAAFCSQCHVAF
jgi:predicted CXXCH cytochrome family protein